MAKFLLMAASLIFSSPVEGHGTYTISLYDLEGEIGSATVKVEAVEGFSYAEPQTGFDGDHNGRKGSEVTVTISGDGDRVIRDAFDLADEDDKRFQIRISGPRNDAEGTTLNWRGTVFPDEIEDTLSPALFPYPAFTLRASDGIGGLDKDVVYNYPEYASPESRRVVRNGSPVAETFWQLREAQGTLQGFDTVRAGVTLRPDGTEVDLKRLRMKRKAEGNETTIEASVDTLSKAFHLSVFQPTSTTNPELWVKGFGTAANVIDISGDNGAMVTQSSFPQRAATVTVYDWDKNDKWGRIRAAGEITQTGDGLGQLVQNPNLDHLIGPTPEREGWEHVGGPVATQVPPLESEGAVLTTTSVYRARLVELPVIEKCGVWVELKQQGLIDSYGAETGFARVQIAYASNNGNTYVYNGTDWVIRDPGFNPYPTPWETYYASGTFYSRPIDSTDARVTAPLPTDTNGGTLWLYLYGWYENGTSAEVNEVTCKLYDTEKAEFIETLTTKPVNVVKGQPVELPLITDWEYDDPENGWQLVSSWFSELTDLFYQTFAEGAAAERIYAHTKLRLITAEIDGLYTPEYTVTFQGGPFATDVVTRIVACELDLKNNLTKGTFLEIA